MIVEEEGRREGRKVKDEERELNLKMIKEIVCQASNRR